MTTAERRIQLFDLYQRSLSYFWGPGQLFMCPFCRRQFNETSIKAGPSQQVDLAHCYPKSCGGNLQTLACKKCNSTIGHKYETHLAGESKLHHALDPLTEGAVDGRLKFPTGDIGVEVSRNKSGMELKVIAGQTDPAAIEALKAYMLGGGDRELTLKLNLFSQKKAAVATWHSAFLMMFREFGYEFALSPLANKLRQLLADAESLDGRSLPCSAIPSEALDRRLMNSIGIAKTDDGLRCFCLFVPSPNPDVHSRCLLLPGMENDAEAEYQKLIQRPSAKVRFSYSRISGMPEYRLQRRAFRAYLRCNWFEWSLEKMLGTEAILAINDLAADGGPAFVSIFEISKRTGLAADETMLRQKGLNADFVVFSPSGDEVAITPKGVEALGAVGWK